MTSLHHVGLALSFLILGGCVGSFLNVCAYRIPRSISLFHPGSRCPHCLTPIRARDNIPVLGWLSLAGRCRHCRGTISPRYAVVELTVGLLFSAPYLLAIGIADGDLWERVGALSVLSALIAGWTFIALVVVATLIGSDRRRASGNRRLGSSLVGQSER